LTRKTPYVSAHLTEEARDALRRLTLNASAAAGRRVSQSEVVLAALAVVDLHPDEFSEALESSKEGS
jgi:hypothetical protein